MEATLPGYRVRVAGGAWIDVRAPRFVIGSSPRAQLVIGGAPRHLRLELGADAAVVRALDGPLAIRGVAVLAAPLGASDGADGVTVELDAAGVPLEIQRHAPWAPPPASLPGLDGA